MSPERFDWSGRTVLITGATGMLGSSLLSQLRERSAKVSAISRDGLGIPGTVESIACDLASAENVFDSLSAPEFDVIFHLAAQSQDTETDPRSTFEANVVGTLNLLEAVRVGRPDATMVVASTYAITTRWHALLSPEDAEDSVRPYDASKLCAEVVTRCYRDSYRLHVGIARLPNLFGPRDGNMRRLVPGTICAAIRGEPPVIRSDPRTPINFLYVDEAATAMLRFAEQIALGKPAPLTVSIKSLESLTLGEMVETILAQMDRLDLLPEMTAGKSAIETNDLAASMTREEEEHWNWQPQVTLQEGLRRTIDWYVENYSR